MKFGQLFAGRNAGRSKLYFCGHIHLRKLTVVNTAVKDPETLLPRFGLSSFRRGQEVVIDAILAGHDTLCIMPTGGGKSLCYQLPTLAREGVTIVVSPLIALMKDQVDSLIENEIAATFINSTLGPADQHARVDGMVDGRYKLVYIAPERLRSSSFMRAVGQTNIQMLAIDEAHCISHWGHDFRPDYGRLGRLRKRLGNPQTVALTATATELVQKDIALVLELENPATFVSGFARENLALKVESPSSNSEKDERLTTFLNERPGCGIIYASTRKSCEHIVELLDGQVNRPVAFYHAGMQPQTRREVQENFMSGETPIIVATNAFGMGIDKSDLRFVIHYNIPGSVEAYYQEAGRAGRDGKPSECLMLYSYQDRFIQNFFVENSYPSRDTVKEIYDYLRSLKSEPIEMTLLDIKEELDLQIGTGGIANCENLLEKAGAIERLDSQQNMAAIKIDSELNTLIDMLPRDARVQRHVMSGLEKLVGSLRGERVMFVPQKLAERLEMKWTTLNRHIRELTRLDAVDYVPPFRGRAIHMLCRDKKFEQLEIDFVELERRKKSEYEKLQAVIDLATTRRCRQLEILEYFGDPDRHNCGTCDNCQQKQKERGPKPKHADNNACIYAAQVGLSGVARTKGRFGKTVVAQMLTGSTSKKMAKSGLKKLSTFGLLMGIKQTDAVTLIDWLIEDGYVLQTETTRFRPQIDISTRGLELLGGRMQIDLTDRMPGKLVNALSIQFKGRTPHVAPATVEEPVVIDSKPELDKPLEVEEHTEETLKENEVVQESDSRSTAVEEAVETAADGTGMAGGIDANTGFMNEEACDEHDIPKYADANDSDIANRTERRQQVDPPIVHLRVDLPSPDDIQPAFFWTWRLLTDGYSAEHLRQVRQIDLDTIYDHLIRAADNDFDVQPGWMLSDSQIDQLESTYNAHANQRLTALIAALPEGISPRQLMYFLKCRDGISQH